AEAPPSGLAGERPAEAAGAGGADRTDSTSAAAGAVAAPGIATDGRPAGAPANATRPQPTPGLQLDFGSTEEESELARTIATTDWSRVFWLCVVLAVALTAFFLKKTGFRYVALAATIAFLGFLDGSFLSISHVTAAI